MSKLGFILIISLLTFCGCRPHIVRNYEFGPTSDCDCILKSPPISIGGRSTYFSKSYAFCNRSTYDSRRDSVFNLTMSQYDLFDEYDESDFENDSLGKKFEENRANLIALKKDWTKCRIKTKYKGQMIDSTFRMVVLKRKIRYYNKYQKGRNKMGVEKFIGDSLVKSTLKEPEIRAVYRLY